MGELTFGRAPASKQPQINVHRPPPPTPKKIVPLGSNTQIQKYKSIITCNLISGYISFLVPGGNNS